MQTPRYIFADDFSAFETFFKSVPGRRCSFKKGDSLWAPGQPFSPVYYILSGLALTCIHHEEGHRKILSFHGKGTVFPVYHSNRFKIEKSIVTQALEDVEALEFSPSQFRRMMEERFPLTETVIDWYASYVNLLLYETAHQEYNSAFIKLCNLLYLLAEREEMEAGPVIYLSQEELADILAANRVNLSRNLSRLRQEGIIATGRKQIRILRPDLLAAHCSSETLWQRNTAVRLPLFRILHYYCT